MKDTKLKVCFFAKVESMDDLKRVKFYADDIQILKDLGHEVIVARTFSEIPMNCDLYFVWWWTWAFLPILKTKLKSKPIVITGTFDYETKPKGAGFIDRPFWEKMLIQFSLKQANANVFVSELERKLVPEKLKVTNPKYSPHIVDTQKYVPGTEPKENFILTVAWSQEMNAKRKCLRQIIETMPYILEKHPDVRLIMAGKPGDYHSTLVQLAHELKVDASIDFRGLISEEEKIRLMQRCKVYLQPTLFEGFGLAIAEAMACGAAVVSSPAGAVPEVVGPCGLLENGQNPKEIAQAVISLLDNQTLRDELGQRATQRINDLFTYERRKKELKQVILETVKM
jgi:glycosyltransferase involved in cell wall biosynthesis